MNLKLYNIRETGGYHQAQTIFYDRGKSPIYFFDRAQKREESIGAFQLNTKKRRELAMRRHFFKALTMTAIVIFIMSVGLSTVGFAAKKVVGKFGHTGATASDYGQTILEFAKRVNNRAPGLEIQVFGDSTLGGTQTLIEGIQLGNVHLANAGYGSLGAFVSELGAMELPFIFGRKLDIDQILKVTDSDLYEEWQNMLNKKIGARVVAPAWYYGHRDILVKKPANKPNDLKGVKIRVVPAPLYVEIMRGLGAVPTPVDWPEVYNALKQGVIDGVDAATDSIEYMKFYEGAKHYLGTHHITGLNAMIANSKWYDSLASEDKKILDEELAWFMKEFARRLQEIKPGVLEKLQAVGVTIHKIDLPAFQKAITDANVAEKVAKAGKWRSDTLDRFREVLKAAGYKPNF